jgi:hypothetical protein
MALSVTRKELESTKGRLEALKQRAKKLQAHGEVVAMKLLRTAEVGGAAFLAGAVHGKTGGVEIVGVPLDIGAGLVLNGLSLFGVAGKASDHVGAVGDGFIAAYTHTIGIGVGVAWKEKANLPAGADSKPLPAAKSAGLSDDEFAAELARRRAAGQI